MLTNFVFLQDTVNYRARNWLEKFRSFRETNAGAKSAWLEPKSQTMVYKDRQNKTKREL